MVFRPLQPTSRALIFSNRGLQEPRNSTLAPDACHSLGDVLQESRRRSASDITDIGSQFRILTSRCRRIAPECRLSVCSERNIVFKRSFVIKMSLLQLIEFPCWDA